MNYEPTEDGAYIGTLPAALGLEVLSIIGKFAGGKPMTPEVIGKLELPPGVTVEDAMECVRWAAMVREKQKADVFHVKQQRNRMLEGAMTIRARLGAVEKMVRPSKSDRRARMAKESRRRNRR